ncbi:alpha-L-rhamnosidase [Clostridium sp. CAG:448]|nr:alpha-L-rhamnosidase [Clostridium sp. CAG:448]
MSAVNRAARLLGVSEPYDYCAAADAYMRTFYRPASGLFADTADSAHTAIGSNAFALLLDLPLPDGNGAILELIRQKRLNASNLFVSPLILFGLFRAGQTDLLYDLLCDRNYWLRMLAEGATTTFEAFGKDRKWNTSLCHTMFALPVAFLCGWSPDDYLGACPASES